MPTEFNDKKTFVTIGGKKLTVNFNIPACRRIEQEKPGFSILNGSLPDFEITPFLLRNGIDPADAFWKDENEFLTLYEECNSDELSLVVEAYQNAVGFTNRIFHRTLGRIEKELERAKEESRKAKK